MTEDRIPKHKFHVETHLWCCGVAVALFPRVEPKKNALKPIFHPNVNEEEERRPFDVLNYNFVVNHSIVDHFVTVYAKCI